jgi:transcriptional regulator with XRE-family HTH domain
MKSSQRLAISDARGSAHALKAAAKARGFTLRELAVRLDVSPALLSMVATGKRAMTEALRVALRREIGWPA